ncbi:MAG: hypothetical protein IJZ68_09065 [Bacteroidaceae bacterium]|nr:hypothetical protein [Bacteroidaceae bacterium]
MSYQRARERNRRLRKLYDATKNGYGAGAGYDEEKGRYYRYSCHDRDLKAHCRRVTRRRLKNIHFDANLSGGAHKKVFDYWWTLL